MSNSGKKTADDDEVEQLLRAAHDDIFLKLNLNSHMARASASAAIDPDLDRRFQALKKPTKIDDATRRNPNPTKKSDTGVGEAGGAVAAADDDDLFARFAALKNTIPSHNRNEGESGEIRVNQDGEESEDEVEKVIKWAIDAARLDPSPPSDDDNNNGSDDDDDDDSDDEEVNTGKKGKRK